MKNPISVYIIWHPQFEDGIEYAHSIYSEISRLYDDPTIITCGIPTYFTEKNSDFEHQIKIDFETAERIAIFLFVDNKMLLADESWYEYLSELSNSCKKNDLFRIYPVAFNRNSIRIQLDELNEINFIRLFEIEESERKDYLIFCIKHDLCKLLYRNEKEDKDSSNTKKPVKLFLSHAKADGKEITKYLRDYINENTGIDDFFDAVDIEQGKKFIKEIENNITTSSILIAIQTDAYSKSEWCKKEILIAKENRIPILIINCLIYGEKRTFPYLGNAHTIRCSEKSEMICIKVLSLAMSEILSKLYQREITSKFIQIYNLSINSKSIFDSPPELLSLTTCADLLNNRVIYPEPPLGHSELELLNKTWPNIQLITPISIPSLIYKRKLNGLKVGISVSDPKIVNQDGIGITQYMAVSLEIARYLLSNGMDLCYGGDINFQTNENFTKNLIKLVEIYDNEYIDDKKKITNYVPGYISSAITDEMRIELKDYVKFIIMEQNLLVDEIAIDIQIKQRINKLMDLYNIRKRMNEDIDARIAIGGKSEGFLGRCPGILEEVFMAIINKKPIYLVGGFGGITSDIIKYIIGENSDMTSIRNLKNDELERNFVNYYNLLSTEEEAKIDYDSLYAKIKQEGIHGLNNGLTEGENLTLFRSKNINEIISIILKGLFTIYGNKINEFEGKK